jgi:hypothetical protein
MWRAMALLLVGALTVPVLAAPATAAPTVSFETPPDLAIGGPAEEFTATATNDGALFQARFDFELVGPDGFDATDLLLEYEVLPESGTFQAVPLTDDGENTVTGSFGPANGFPFPTTTNETLFRVTALAGAPAGSLTVTTDLNRVNAGTGAVEQTFGTDTSTSELLALGAAITGAPAEIVVGTAASSFTSTATNETGSDFDDIHGEVRLSGIDGLAPGDVTMTADLGEGPITVPLTADGDDLIATFGGLVLADGDSLVVPITLALADDAPTGTLTVTTSLFGASGEGPALASDSVDIDVIAAEAPTLTAADLAPQIVAGAAADTFTVTLDNVDGADLQDVRVQVLLDGPAGLLPANVTMTADPGSGATTVTLTPGEGNGDLVGFLPPAAGTDVSSGGTVTYTITLAATGTAPLGDVDASFALVQLVGGNPTGEPLATEDAATEIASATTTVLDVDPTTATVGDDVTLEATVTKARQDAPAPTGTVTFRDGEDVLGTAPIVAGVATLVTDELEAGAYSVTATYPGAELLAPSTSNAVALTVEDEAVALVGTTTDLVITPAVATLNGNLTFTATVDAVSGVVVPTGSVVFAIGGNFIGADAVDSNGVAVLTVQATTLGDFVATAAYQGDDLFEGSTSDEETATVQAPTKIGRFVDTVYQVVLGRNADVGGLNYWTNRIQSGQLTRQDFGTSLFTFPEVRGAVCSGVWQGLLGRAITPGERDGCVAALASIRRAELIAGVTGSAEYFGNAGGTNNLFLDAVYQDLLGRAPDPQGRAYWNAQFAAGTPRNAVADFFATSPERFGIVVDEAYQQFLGRNPDASGRSYWIGQLRAGLPEEKLYGLLIGSEEFFAQV